MKLPHVDKLASIGRICINEIPNLSPLQILLPKIIHTPKKRKNTVENNNDNEMNLAKFGRLESELVHEGVGV